MSKLLQGTLRSGHYGVNRIEAFSDGVFAIVVTILVLELRVPEVHHVPDISQALQNGLFHLIPKFLSYILSFGYVSIYWVNHHILFQKIKKADRGLFWMNCFFLMWLAFIPFPTALIGEYSGETVAVIIYGVIMFLTAISFVAMKWYAVSYAKLVDPSQEEKLLQQSMFQIVAGPALYTLAIIFSFFNTAVSIGIYILIPVIYFFPVGAEKNSSR